MKIKYAVIVAAKLALEAVASDRDALSYVRSFELFAKIAHDFGLEITR